MGAAYRKAWGLHAAVADVLVACSTTTQTGTISLAEVRFISLMQSSTYALRRPKAALPESLLERATALEAKYLLSRSSAVNYESG